MKRRWLFFWVALAVASFGLIMQAAHIGSTNLWIVVSAVAFVSAAIVAGTLNAAGRRLRPWPSRPRGLAALSDLSSLCATYTVGLAIQHDHELRHRQRQQQREPVARQKILTRDDRPRLWAVIDEAVIRRVVGGTEVMRGQLRYLADPAQQGKTTIQVVPYRAGAHAGTTGPFVILDFEEPADPAMVYVETLAGDIYLEERSDVNRYTLAFDRLRAASLHPDDSVQLIEQAASTMT